MWRTAFLCAALCGISGSSLCGQDSGSNPTAAVRIGVYDSRAIAVAWAASKHNPVAATMKEFKAAQEARDTKKIAELEAWGKNHQRLLHFQGFGHVPVGDLLAPVRPQIKQLISDKQLVAITMECDETAANVELVDVTEDLVKLYEPSEQTLKWVKQLRDKEPLSLLELADLPADK